MQKRRSQPTESQSLLRRSGRARQLSLQRRQRPTSWPPSPRTCRRATRASRELALARRHARRALGVVAAADRARLHVVAVGCRTMPSAAPVLAGRTSAPHWCRRPRPSVPWWRQSTPVWMQAVAATVVFGAGLAVGTSPAATPAPGATAAAQRRRRRGGDRARELTDLEQRLRAELARAVAGAGAGAAGADGGASIDDEALMSRIRDPGHRKRRAPAPRAGAAHGAGAARHRDSAQGGHGDGAAEHRPDPGHHRRRAADSSASCTTC